MLKQAFIFIIVFVHARTFNDTTQEEAISKCNKFLGLLADKMFDDTNTSATEERILEQLQVGDSVWTSKFVVYSMSYSWYGCMMTDDENDFLADYILGREKIYHCIQLCSKRGDENQYFGIRGQSCFCFKHLNHRNLLPLSVQCQTIPSSVTVYRLFKDSINLSTGTLSYEQCVYATKTDFWSQVEYGTASCNVKFDGFICSKRDASHISRPYFDFIVVKSRASLSQAQKDCKKRSKILALTENKKTLSLQPHHAYWTGIFRSYTLAERNQSELNPICLSLKRVDNKLIEETGDCRQLKYAVCSFAEQKNKDFPKEATTSAFTNFTKSDQSTSDMVSVKIAEVTENINSDLNITTIKSFYSTNTSNCSTEQLSQSPTAYTVSPRNHTAPDDKPESEYSATFEISMVLVGTLAALGCTVFILISAITVFAIRKYRHKGPRQRNSNHLQVKYKTCKEKQSKSRRDETRETTNETILVNKPACVSGYIQPMEKMSQIYHELEDLYDYAENTYNHSSSIYYETVS